MKEEEEEEGSDVEREEAMIIMIKRRRGARGVKPLKNSDRGREGQIEGCKWV